MFERRLKIFLLILLVATGVLVLRAMQLQVLGREHWQKQAVEAGKRRELIETTRGTIVDRKNRPIAVDEPCVDACVDYRALIDPPDPKWLEQIAGERLLRTMGNEYKLASRDRRKQLREPEIERVKQDIRSMWAALARESGRTLEEIEETRRAIVHKVEMRQRVLWYWRYRAAMDDQAGRGPSTWYRKWLIGDAADSPEVDSFVPDALREQKEAHPILPDISNDVLITLKKNLEKYPGLEMRDGTRRRYPYRNVACHVLGNLSRVLREDVENDPNFAVNPLRRYELNDLIGRSGLEALCEPALRGTRGYLERESGRDDELQRVEAAAGQTVRSTIDIELQRDVEEMFTRVRVKNDDNSIDEDVEMHGAAVVIDVASGGVLAMASWPTFDANRFNELYAQLARDELNKPLLNRSTQWAVEPGSTVKPIIGLGAIADDRLLVNQGIECTGYLVHRGRKITPGFRCWTASKYDISHPALVPHHQIPFPHTGHHGNPNGFLTFSDAIERSCNVYFETAAGMMGVGGVMKWYDRFGLGRATGVGIPESRGTIPDPHGLPYGEVQRATWFAGIGQGQVGATTIQMANVSATLARGGTWVRPRLVLGDVPTTRPAGAPEVFGPDRVELPIPRAALDAAKAGMINVMASESGTASDKIKLPPVTIAGKTGTAETATRLKTPIRGEDGQIVKIKTPVRDAKGEIAKYREERQYHYYEPVSPQNRAGSPPWYRGFGADGMKLKHAWFIGFAPAERPQVAIAVMVEYGGSGGFSALSVAAPALNACIQHGYLQPTASIVTAGASPAASDER